MKKKLIIAMFVLLLFLGIVSYLVIKPINNDYIEYNSADEYKTELIKAIESEDYKLASNLLYSIAKSGYSEDLINEVEEYRYNIDEDWEENNTITTYNGFVDLLKYIYVSDESSLEIIEVADYSLLEYGILYYEYELDGISGYYVNYPIHSSFNSEWVYEQLNQYESEEECYEYNNSESICEGQLYLDIANEMYSYNYGIIQTYIDYTIVMEDYENIAQEPIVNYASNYVFDQMVEIAYDLDAIMDEDTSQEERDELQYALIDVAQTNGSSSYGQNVITGEYEYADDGSGIIEDIYKTYINIKNDEALYEFTENNYYNQDGSVDMNRLMQDFPDYQNIFNTIENEIII